LAPAEAGAALPLPAILAVLRQKGVNSEALHASWPWQHLVLQHQSWCLLIAAVALVGWTWTRGARFPMAYDAPLVQTQRAEP